MKVIHSTQGIHEYRKGQSANVSIGLVPTMGDLHPGHLSLVEQAQKKSDTTIASIFVNPIQFGANEDFDSYPRVLERDIQKLSNLGVDALFAPQIEDMYPEGQENLTQVTVPEISHVLCGASRPTHFHGVTTVVAKLFNLIQPTSAFFGEKDWQQLTIIKRMASQLNFPISIIGVPTTRETDGLALSSRNRYLTNQEREVAPGLYAVLRELATQIKEGNTDYQHLEEAACKDLKDRGFEPEYVAIRNPDSLQTPTSKDSTIRIFGAARLGRARLIDNIGIGR